MLNTYLTLGQHIFDLVPEIEWIDRDKGQIDHEEDFNSILCPAVLIDFSEVKWAGLNRRNQLGDLTVTTKLIFVKPGETFARTNNPLQDYAVFNALADTLHQVMGQFEGVKERRRSSDYFTRYWYVIEQQYDLEVNYEVPVKTINKPVPTISTNIILPT
jgi:hypothetical protein